MKTGNELKLGPDEVLLWEHGHPVYTQAWVCDLRTGKQLRTVSQSEMKALAKADLLVSLGTPEEAGLKVQTAYPSAVYLMKEKGDEPA